MVYPGVETNPPAIMCANSIIIRIGYARQASERVRASSLPTNGNWQSRPPDEDESRLEREDRCSCKPNGTMLSLLCTPSPMPPVTQRATHLLYLSIGTVSRTGYFAFPSTPSPCTVERTTIGSSLTECYTHAHSYNPPSCAKRDFSTIRHLPTVAQQYRRAICRVEWYSLGIDDNSL